MPVFSKALLDTFRFPGRSSDALWRLSWLLSAVSVSCWFTGCSVLQTPSDPTSGGSPLSWLTQWTSQPIDAASGFDVETIRPAPRVATIPAEGLLEVTVWDLYEPGKPYTFPVRVSPRETIEAPLVGEIPVAGRTTAQLEADLALAYRNGEFLINPRVLVRSLDPAAVKVQVSGAVLRTGYVDLKQDDRSVYAALVATGGVKKNADAQIAVVRRIDPASPTEPGLDDPSAEASADVDEDSPKQQANSLEVLSVDRANHPPAAKDSSRRSSAASSDPRSGRHQRVGAVPGSANGAASCVWYDLEKPDDQEALRELELLNGDEIVVKATASPIRIAGVVSKPGAYAIPAARNTDVWQAIHMAGGIRVTDAPLNITLIRPAAEGRPARRWTLNVKSYSQHPSESPAVEPGDILHVEPTTGSKIRRAVGDLWNKT